MITYNPKTINGDVVASLQASCTTFDELCKRFENGTNGLLQNALFGVVNRLVRKHLLREDKKGVLHCTNQGLHYIREKGYFD